MTKRQVISIYRVQLIKIDEFPIKSRTIRSPEDCAMALKEFLKYLYGGVMPDRELFISLWLNTKNVISGGEVVSVGTVNSSLVHPRETFKSAIINNAASIIVAHNHPSGECTPSPEDIEMTKRMVNSGEILGIDVLDHIIIGDDNYISLQEQGLM